VASPYQALGAEHPHTLDALDGYQITLNYTAHFKEAEQIARYILSIRERTLGLDHPDTIETLQDLGSSVGFQGDHAQAEAIAREVIKRCDRNRLNKRARFIAVKEWAIHRTVVGDPVEADKLMTDAVPSAAREFGPTNLLTLHLQRVLARVWAEEGCFVEAEALARTTLEARLRQATDLEGDGRTMLILGRALMQQGKLDEAEPFLQAALPLLREHIRTKDASAALAANWLGAIQVARNAYPEAEKLLLPDSDRFFDPANQLSPTEVRLALGNIIALYRAWGKSDKAAYWQQELDQITMTRPSRQR
jgi:tetratricopeptide (TPR) repeat protein